MNKTMRVAIFLFFAIAATSSAVFCQSHEAIIATDLNEKINRAEENFETLYYQLVEKGIFPTTYNNNLIINPTAEFDRKKEGIILLRLIEWLEKQNDRECVFLLKKINKFYYLQFFRMLTLFNLEKRPWPTLVETFQNLYHKKITASSKPVAPFRSSIAKMFIFMTIINEENSSLETRRASLVYVFDAIKREMLNLNQQLGDQKIDNQAIEQFVVQMGIYGVQEHLAESVWAKRIFWTVIIIGAIYIIVYILLKYVWPKKEDIKKALKGWAEDFRDFFTEPTAKVFAKEMSEKIEIATKNLKDATTEAIRDGMKTVKGDAHDTTMEAVEGALDGLDNKINPYRRWIWPHEQKNKSQKNPPQPPQPIIQQQNNQLPPQNQLAQNNNPPQPNNPPPQPGFINWLTWGLLGS